MNYNRIRRISFALTGLGLSISIYLLFRHFTLVGSSTGAGLDFCTAIFGGRCDAALSSPLSMQLGIPLAGWGILFYATLLTLILLTRGLGDMPDTCVIRIDPVGRFVTYGIGVPLMQMRQPEKSLARVPVA